jgi:8-oxo-dGTP diphosphatase
VLTPILTTLAFVRHPDGQRVLMCHRIARPEDDQHGKYNGLGGKVEADEDVWTGMVRELDEEAGITPTAMRLRGTISWPGFGADGSDHFGFIFVVDSFVGTPPSSNEEGELTWERIDSLGTLDMWEGDRHFLPLVFDPGVSQFHAVLPYADGRPTHFSAHVVRA